MFAINGSMSSDKGSIAHAFNEYFINLGPTLFTKKRNLSRDPLFYLKGSFKSINFFSVNNNKIASVPLQVSTI